MWVQIPLRQAMQGTTNSFKGLRGTNLLEVVIMYLVEEPSVSDHWDLPLMQDFLEQWLGQSNLVSLALLADSVHKTINR